MLTPEQLATVRSVEKSILEHPGYRDACMAYPATTLAAANGSSSGGTTPDMPCLTARCSAASAPCLADGECRALLAALGKGGAGAGASGGLSAMNESVIMENGTLAGLVLPMLQCSDGACGTRFIPALLPGSCIPPVTVTQFIYGTPNQGECSSQLFVLSHFFWRG